ncbi:unnamed protein product [Knipowitschia caucasica]|uniref:NAD(P)(+)--arginine ADP-ribosyltransferase n=1 Tax=Knipowitschia caucasica TaxID=637954 RepID=A0AAV2KKM0_KNICA
MQNEAISKEAMALTFVLYLMAPIALAQPIELTMMNQSVDDSFGGCRDEMASKVLDLYFPRESQNPPFQNAWSLAEPCSHRDQDELPDHHKALTKHQLQSLCVYTNASTRMYAILNAQIRKGAPMYDTASFQYHALYFWITTALQVLKESCETTYKRTRDVYKGQIGSKIRFGYLTSTSRSPYVVEYGTETCFHIRTCLGAFIGNYSVAPSEEEVLVPSYEEFRIVDIVSDSYGSLECKKIFVLESVGFSSDLNCAAVNHSQGIRANVLLIVILLTSVLAPSPSCVINTLL